MILSIGLLPLLFGCPENRNVTTKINRDGSCERSIGDYDPEDIKEIDSIKNDIPIPIDDSWEVVNINDTTAVFRKHFETVADLNESYSDDHSALRMHSRNVVLIKKFRWFHTLFQYKETYEASITEIPISNYLSEQEAEVFKSDNSEDHPLMKNLNKKAQNSLSDNIEERFQFWLHDNFYSMAFDNIVKAADSLDLIDLKQMDVSEAEDTIKQIIDKAENLFMTFEEDQLDHLQIAKLFGNEMNFDSVSTSILIRAVDALELDEKFENKIMGGFGDEYDNHIIMPGLLIDTNAEVLNSDTLSWHVGPVQFIDSDYVMYAESKITNHWAYLVSGFILAIAIIIPFLRRKKA